MKRNIYLITILLMIGFCSDAQTQFWFEDFGTNPVCATNQGTAFTSANGAWTGSITGTQQTLANMWYVSATEAGMGVGNCGNGCQSNPTLTNRTMHISTHTSLFGDIGSAYVAGSGAGTNIRVQSPTINCGGKTGVVMSYKFIHWGIVGMDYCEAMYSGDNGATWSTLGIPPQTPTVSCAGQGLWASTTVTLPPGANNNPTVKIGFRWQNTDPTGSDPSVAIDDIALTYTAATTPSFAPTFTMPASICQGDSIQLTANTGTFAVSGYSWSTNATGPLIATPNASVTWAKFLTVGVNTVVLTAQSGTQVASTSKTIVVNPSPVITAAANPTNNTICNGNSATLTASGGLSYTWTPPGSSSNPIVVSPTTNATYQVVGTNTFGCKGYASKNITVNPKPNVGVTSSTMNVCAGSTATLTATGASTYSWAPITASSAVVVISPTAASTTYSVIGTSSAGCTNSNTITITTSTCGTGMGISAYAESELPFSIFPNPVKDKITIKAGDVNLNNVKIELFDILGKKMLEQSFSNISANTEQSIQVSNLPKGVFTLSVNVDGVQQKAVRLVKE
jgi:hypothetical protein